MQKMDGFKALSNSHKKCKTAITKQILNRGVAQQGKCEASVAKRHSAVRSPHQSHKGNKKQYIKIATKI
jgi:hypothetical protein